MSLGPSSGDSPPETPPSSETAAASEPPPPPPPPELTPEQKKAQEEAAENARELAAACSLFAAMYGSVTPARLMPTRGKGEAATPENHFYTSKLEALPAEVDLIEDLLVGGGVYKIEKNPDPTAETKIIKLSPRAYSDMSGRLPKRIRELGGTVPSAPGMGTARG